MTDRPRDDAPFGLRLLAPLMLGSVLNPLNAMMIATALPTIGRSFEAGTRSTAWLVSGLYLAAAVGQPTAGRLADVVGPRRVFLWGLAIVLAAGLLGALAPTLGVLVAARVLLGLGTATGFPTALAIIRRRADEAGVGVPSGVLGMLAITGQVSLALGPLLGGVLVGVVGWRAVLAINVPLALAGIALALSSLPRDRPRDRAAPALRHALDLAGIGLFSATVVALLLAIRQLDGGDPAITVALWAATGVAGAGLVARELRCRDPFVDLRMLASERGLTATIGRYAATFVVLYSVLYGFTQWLEEARGLTPETVGAVMAPMLLVGIAAAAVASRQSLVERPLLIGTAALIGGSVALLVVDAGTPAWLLIVLVAVFGLPNGLNFVANQAALFQQAPAERMGSASGLYRTGQYLAAVVASTLIGLTFGARPSDAGLHDLAVLLVALATLVLAVTLAGRGQLPRVGASGIPTGTSAR